MQGGPKTTAGMASLGTKVPGIWVSEPVTRTKASIAGVSAIVAGDAIKNGAAMVLVQESAIGTKIEAGTGTGTTSGITIALVATRGAGGHAPASGGIDGGVTGSLRPAMTIHTASPTLTTTPAAIHAVTLTVISRVGPVVAAGDVVDLCSCGP